MPDEHGYHQQYLISSENIYFAAVLLKTHSWISCIMEQPKCTSLPNGTAPYVCRIFTYHVVEDKDNDMRKRQADSGVVIPMKS